MIKCLRAAYKQIVEERILLLIFYHYLETLT